MADTKSKSEKTKTPSDEERSLALAESRREAAEIVRGDRGLTPGNLAQMGRVAETIVKSGLMPSAQGNPAAVLVALEFGMTAGLSVSQCVSNVMVVNGRPAIWGDALLALVLNARNDDGQRVCEWHHEAIEGTGDKMVAVCRMKRAGYPEPNEIRFSVDDAKTAGLWKKSGPWSNHPKRMLQMRARAFCIRDLFPDVLMGMSIAEEMQDVKPIEVTRVSEEPEEDAAALRDAVRRRREQEAPVEAEVEEIEEAEVEDEPTEAEEQAEPSEEELQTLYGDGKSKPLSDDDIPFLGPKR